MPRTEVYRLRLTKDEKDKLADMAREKGVSIAQLLRNSLGLARSSTAEQPPVKRQVEGSSPSAPVKLDAVATEGAKVTFETRAPLPVEVSAEYIPLVNHLKNNGYTTPVAERMAKDALGL